jgi:hypothetical protein
MTKVYGKTNGHHCFWLTINGKPVANFDNESDVDGILSLENKHRLAESVISKVIPSDSNQRQLLHSYQTHKTVN